MKLTRRGVIKHLSWAAGLSAALYRPEAAAEDSNRLKPQDPAAVALGYVENTSQLNAKKTPGFVPGSNCENCLQLQGTAGNNYRPCSLFPGKLVSVSGWCKSWTPEM